MNKSLTTKEIKISTDQIALIKDTIAKGASDQELELFMYDCRRRGVHPLDRMIHFTKRGGKYTPITGIDFLRSRADATGEYVGSEDPVIGYEGASKDRPDSATVTVWRLIGGQKCPFTATARWKEYFPGDELGFMWKKMPTTMLAKCAEALALRKAFPQQLSGLYTTEEMDQAGPTNKTSHRASQEATVTDLPEGSTEELPLEAGEENGNGTSEPTRFESWKNERISDAQRKRFYAIAKESGKSDDKIKSWLKERTGSEATKDIKRGDYEKLCEEVKA